MDQRGNGMDENGMDEMEWWNGIQSILQVPSCDIR